MISWSQRFDEVLIAKVNGQLTIAHQHLARLLDSRGAEVTSVARSADLAQLRSSNNRAAIEAFLASERARLGLDFLYMLAADDSIVASPPVSNSGGLTGWPVVSAALAGRQSAAIDIFSAADLARFDPALADRARLTLVETAAAVPTDRLAETRGMVAHVAAPTPGGALVGGLLLNRNLAFIDEINELVYPEASVIEGGRGTATLFLDDVRISTNVRLFEDVRALGTRVSAVVRVHVLDKGEVWLDRAFVVNDWYVSAYEPILDSYGNRVGMLYVGFLDAPFAQARLETLLQSALGFLAMLLVAVPILLRWARGIFAPLERMNRTIAAVDGGDLGARTGRLSRSDEIGRLAAHLDELLDRLQEREVQLRGWADELEMRVADRTRDLEEANRQLDIATRQLIVSEKLAAIGEITAGVAHEINNPLAVIQGNLDVIHNDLGGRAAPLRTEFRLIDEQVQAIHVIVSKLLQFARPEEYADTGDGVDPDQVVRDTLPLVQHLLADRNVEISLDLACAGPIAMNQTELQQVLINLITNAIQAMPDGGRLDITTRAAERDGAVFACIAVADTGIGMDSPTMARVFDPFFTTKWGRGTGLGLSISRNLVMRVGGTIDVESTPGEGATFEVMLPIVAANDARKLRSASEADA